MPETPFEDEYDLRYCWDGTPCDQGDLPCAECSWAEDFEDGYYD